MIAALLLAALVAGGCAGARTVEWTQGAYWTIRDPGGTVIGVAFTDTRLFEYYKEHVNHHFMPTLRAAMQTIQPEKPGEPLKLEVRCLVVSEYDRPQVGQHFYSDSEMLLKRLVELADHEAMDPRDVVKVKRWVVERAEAPKDISVGPGNHALVQILRMK